MPRIRFTYQHLANICKNAAIQRKDLAFCSKIPIAGYYKSHQKKYGLCKSKTYKGKPHDTHVRIFKRKKYGQQKKCKYFICGEPGHFARDCKRKTGNIVRAAVIDQLDLPSDYDILSIDLNEPDLDAICSFSEGETSSPIYYAKLALEDMPWEVLETIFMMGPDNYGWRAQVFVGDAMKNCPHDWLENQPIPEGRYLYCTFCKMVTTDTMQLHCLACHMTSCPSYSKFYLDKIISYKEPSFIPHYEK